MKSKNVSRKKLIGVMLLTTVSALSLCAVAGSYDGNDPNDPPKVATFDTDKREATGSLVSTRFSNDTTSRIGCGSSTYVNGVGEGVRSGFCQVVNSEGDSIRCTTNNDVMIDQIRSVTAASYIRFGWATKIVEAVNDEGNLQAYEVHTCDSIYISTDSRYVPASDAGL